jgi:hypothetical protein
MTWGQFGAERVHGHRECNSPKTCPGAAINMVAVRSELRLRVVIPDNRPAWRVVRDTNIRAGSTTTAPAVGSLLPGDTWRGYAVHGQRVGATDVWVDSGDGRYVWAGNLRGV